MSDETSSKFEKLIGNLEKELKLTGREIAEILWLAQQYQTTTKETSHPNRQIKETKPSKPDNKIQPPENNIPQVPTTSTQLPEPQAKVFAQSSPSTSNSTSGNTLDIKVPDAPGLRQPLKLLRAIRPLIQKIDSDTEVILDEEGTANRIAKDGIRIPIFKPRLEPAFDLMLVVDESSTMIFWRKAIEELQQLFQVLGAFRDVQVWGLVERAGSREQGAGGKENNKKEINKEIYLQRGIGKTARKHRHFKPRSLVDPSGKRLILVASDCVSDIWHNGKAFEMLNIWTKTNTVAIIQMLPQWLWQRTGLSLGAKVQFSSLTPRIANQDLLIKRILLWDDITFATGIKIPIFTLEEESARTWSKMTAGRSDAHVTGFVFSSNSEDSIPSTESEEDSPTSATPEIDTEEITSSFRRTSSPIARKLASLLSAAPIITLPVVRIIQAQMLPQSQQVHVAEVFLGGIIKRKPQENLSPNLSPTRREALNSPPSLRGKGAGGLGVSTPHTPEINPDDIEFDFINEDARKSFLDAAPVTDSLEIIEAISKYFAKKLGKTLSEFNALLRKPQQVDDDNKVNIEKIKPFALLSAKVLKRLGGDYVRFAEEIEQEWKQRTPKDNKNPLQLTDFTFETVTVNRQGEIINREPKTAQYFTENIKPPSPITRRGVGGEVILEMVYIPGGTFMMGSPEGEGDDDEKPQHQVTVPPFFMGKYQITQEQWKAVANLPQVDRELKPEPSNFKPEENQKNNLPVENVSWYDAEEFCKRLSKHTGKQYRLASEAEWEYACRAGTTTPFHFGETITSELANYNASYTFADEPKGENREKTTPVGQFPPNAFGLYDMHGNVWEWCYDPWHGNYEGAPKNGSIWIDKNSDSEVERVLRGGSWDDYPGYCRSAGRGNDLPVHHDDTFGFRVVCGVSPQDS